MVSIIFRCIYSATYIVRLFVRLFFSNACRLNNFLQGNSIFLDVIINKSMKIRQRCCNYLFFTQGYLYVQGKTLVKIRAGMVQLLIFIFQTRISVCAREEINENQIKDCAIVNIYISDKDFCMYKGRNPRKLELGWCNC